MKIKLVSDLHITNKYYPHFLKKYGDILIIAGDIGELNNIELFKQLFDDISKYYNHIIIIPGNHCFYNGNYPYSLTKYQNLIKEYNNIYLLNNDVLKIDDITFLGTILWTNFNNDSLSKFYSKIYINDFRTIHFEDKLCITPDNMLNLFNENVDWLKSNISANDTIIISHFAPSFLSIHEKYKDNELNYYFCSDLSNFILDHPQIKYWFHGHTHNNFNYKIGETNIICNPHGYGKENSDFNKNLVIKI